MCTGVSDGNISSCGYLICVQTEGFTLNHVNLSSEGKIISCH